MQRLRHAHLITRMVLVWLVLTLGIAVAAPLVQPEAVQLVCSGSGAMKLVPQGDGDNGGALATRVLDCPLCIAIDTPPPIATPPVLRVSSAVAFVGRPPAEPAASFSASPAPGRGPPLLLTI
jgi:hypothetical protein